MILEGFAAFFTSLAFGVLFKAPRRVLLVAGGVGVTAWLGWVLTLWSGGTDVLARLIGAAAVAWTSEVLARRLRQPVTVLAVPGILPLVPGVRAYLTMQTFLAGAISQGIEAAVETALAAGAIATGFILVSSVMRMRPRKQWGQGGVR